MKRFPQIDRFFTAICSFLILALFVLLSSCEKDSFYDDSARIKTAKTITASLRTFVNYDDCSNGCIDQASETYYAKSDSRSVTNGGGRGSNTKEVGYIAYNTGSQFIVEVLYQITEGSSNAKATIAITIDGNNKTIEEVASGAKVSHAIELPVDWQACDIIDFKVYQEALGSPIEFNESYALIGVCGSSCEESFSYSENDDGSYTFTYISSEVLQDAEVKLTCPHITDFEALDGKTYTVNPGHSQGAPTVLTWTGDLNACTEMTFTLLFEADCDQANSGKVNLFTDFKVNGESKKGSNETIKFECAI